MGDEIRSYEAWRRYNRGNPPACNSQRQPWVPESVGHIRERNQFTARA